MAHSDGLETRTLYRVEGPESAKANTLIKYTLFSEDEHNNLVDVEVKQLDGWLKGPSECHGKVIRVKTGEYHIEFYPAANGIYHLEVTTEGKQIFKKGDITTTVSGNDPRVRDRINFELEGHGLHSGRIREKTDITIRVSDTNKRPTDIDIDGLEVLIDGPSHTRGALASRGPGTYVASFQIDVAGDYTVTVTYDGRNVIEQPSVSFSDKTSPSASIISQLPRNEVQINAAQHFRIQSKDSRGNTIHTGGDEWEAVASGPERVSHLTITDNNDGTYTGEFILPKVGTYSFEVRLKGQTASNSPFKVKGV